MSGHDPTGAAGIQADIESISIAGCKCISVVTALTVQNTSTFNEVIPQTEENFKNQARCLLSDINVDACKIGLLGDIHVARAISGILDSIPEIPVVFDPIISSGTGKYLLNAEIIELIKYELLKKTFILTPNRSEARQLTGIDDIYKEGESLLKSGAANVLITGADDNTEKVNNVFFCRDSDPAVYEWERLPGVYHGSGCTLSATIAAYIATGMGTRTAIEDAQEYTWKTLKYGTKTGLDQKHPDRFYSH